MEHFVQATEKALADKNWYAALVLALTMPDICGRLQDPTQKSQQRYEAWYEKYLLPSYQDKIGGETHTFLCASDCYALRCAFLHQGEFGIEDQRAKTALALFHFTVPPSNNGLMHKVHAGDYLQLQVNKFCNDVCAAVRQWQNDVAVDPAVRARIDNLGHIGPALW